MADEPLARLNALPPDEADAELLTCCAAPSWVAAVSAGRPYTDLASVLAASDTAFARMTAADMSAAVAAHARIGDRRTGEPTGPAAPSKQTGQRGDPSRTPAGHEGNLRSDPSDEVALHAREPVHDGATREPDRRDGVWSRQEQAGVAGASADTLAALAAGNRAYEERFGQVFLICATGLSAAAMLAALRTRLGNDADTEAKIVREELRKITGLRLRKLLGGEGT
jgi:2-oxo-4-hydroxy-4-carboxy-5-ureidoimidazoline decarboxylase